MRHQNRWLAGLAAVALVLTTAATAFAYTGTVDASITVAPRGSITCTAPFTVAATILDAEGQPVAGQSVAWSIGTSVSSEDRINATPTVTDEDGVATTTVTLGPVNGKREIRATTGEVSASAVIDAACAGGLPSTSTAPGQGSDGAPLAALLVLAVVGAAGGRIVLRRVAIRS